MRVIAGIAKRTRLKTIPGMETRPTTDRIKETLFNILQKQIADCCFLDLFSGSGAIGIEALSRGAKEAVFIENRKKAVQCIKDNLEATHLSQKAHIYQMDVMDGLTILEQEKKPFDLVFMDPPYQEEWERKVLEYLKCSPLICPESLIIIEASIDTTMEYIKKLGFSIEREKKYKTNQHIFLTLSKNSAIAML